MSQMRTIISGVRCSKINVCKLIPAQLQSVRKKQITQIRGASLPPTVTLTSHVNVKTALLPKSHSFVKQLDALESSPDL